MEYSQFEPLAGTIVFEKVIKPHLGQVTNDELVNDLVSRLQNKLDGYEAILGKEKYLAGEEVTLADLFHLPGGSIIFEHLNIGLDGRPNLQRWWKDISSRQSWEAVKNGA